MKVFVKGFNSCVMRRGKVDQYRQFLVAGGHELVKTPDLAEVILVWSCGFRGDVRDNCIAKIKELEIKFPSAGMVIGGCLPDIDEKLLRRNTTGELVPWKNERENLIKIFGPVPSNKIFNDFPYFSEEKLCDCAAEYRREHPGSDVQFHDEFIKILVSEGCGHNCTYCSERLVFPAYRSYPIKDIVEEFHQITSKTGEKKVVLVADSLGEYGNDIGCTLIDLINSLVAHDNGVIVALNNLNPKDFFEYFDEYRFLVRQNKIAHINLPVQSGSNKILSAMNREYTVEECEQIFGMLRSEGFYKFDTHVIIGFPGEDEKEFIETLEFVINQRPTYVLASQYMETPRMRMSAENFPEKSSQAEINNRLERFYNETTKQGIICNIEGGDVMQERLCRLNQFKGVN